MTTDHIEDVRGMVPVAWGAFHFGGSRNGKLYAQCDTKDQIEAYIAQIHQSNDSITLRSAPLYTQPADCPRCAELEATNRQLNREVISVGEEAEDYAGKLATLEAENARLNNRRADGYLYEIPITGGTYNTHYSPRKPTDVRCLNVREVFSNDAN